MGAAGWEHDAVFLGPEGGLVKKDWVSHSFKRACRKAEVENLRFHDLRHDCGSRLAMAGVDLRTLQEILGHKTLAMTLRYAHLSPEHRLRAVRHLDEEVVPIAEPDARSKEG